MTPRLASLWLVVPLALLACSTSRDLGPPAAKHLSSAQSYVVTGQLHLTPASSAPAPVSPPSTSEQQLVLRVDPSGNTALLAIPGQAAKSALASDDGVAFRTTAPITLSLGYGSCGSSATYNDFHFTAVADGVSGAATGTAYIADGDVDYPYTAVFDFTGVPDLAGPSLAGTNAALDPLAALPLTSSEPLPSGTTARLVSAQDSIDLIARLPTGTDVVTAFDKPDVALRYETTYAVAVDPWTDLAGNPGTAAGQVVTTQPPPVAAEDGFEGAGATVGGAAVVDATVVPPINGSKSVFVSPRGFGPQLAGISSTRLTVRLAVTPDDRFVRFTLRPLSPYTSGGTSTYSVSIKIAAPGGAIARVTLPPQETLGSQQTLPGGASVWMGDSRPIEVALPAGTVDEVVFDFIAAAPSSGCGLYPPTASYLLDDLRVE
jgi:hypothetical protein